MRGQGSSRPSTTPSSYGVQSVLTPGPPTEEQATPPAPGCSPVQPICSASTRGAPSLRFQAPDPGLGPPTLLFWMRRIRCSKQLLLRKVACSTGRSSHASIMGMASVEGSKVSPAKPLASSTSGQPETFLPCCPGWPFHHHSGLPLLVPPP